MIEVLHGDSTLELSMMPDNSIDSIVTDPPYGINFMGKHWDYDLPNVDVWKECLRVLKPGGHILVACGTRTQHRMAVNVEDAGFEIRDVITWHYGSGFPKSLDVSKAIDKAAKVERKVVGKYKLPNGQDWNLKQADTPEVEHAPGTFTASGTRTLDVTAPTTDEAKQWNGWGTALKPATEFWTLARKPLSEKTIAENVIKWGTGAININDCRVELEQCDERDLRTINRNVREGDDGWGMQDNKADVVQVLKSEGRFPANLIHDGSEEVLEHFPDANGQLAASRNDGSEMNNTVYSKLKHAGGKMQPRKEGNKSAARFFYCAKASKSERNKGLEDSNLEKEIGHNRFDKCLTCGGTILQNPDRPSACTCDEPVRAHNTVKGNYHPTVKPVALMQYLCRLITPPGGTVLDPFAGSGTTGVAAKLENFSAILIEREAEYIEIINKRTA